MDNIIHEITKAISMNLEASLKTLIQEGEDISGFIQQTKRMLDGIGVRIVAEALTAMDMLVKDSVKRKKEWAVKSKADKKTLSTIFGEVCYVRTYECKSSN